MCAAHKGVAQAYVGKAHAELLSLANRGVMMAGNAFSSVLLLKGELNQAEKDGRGLLSGADGDALRTGLQTLGYAPEDWAGLSCVLASGAPMDAALLTLCIATFDPATVIACDDVAVACLREAYADELSVLPDFNQAMLAPGVVAYARGMRLVSLGGFEASLANPQQKQVAWACLKRVPPLGEPL